MITIRALGPVDVTVNGRPAPPELLWRKNLALLVYLARSPRRTRTREHLMGLLWGDKPESAARHSLREAIRVLRQAGGDDLLDASGDRVRLAEDGVTLDVEDFEARAGAGDWAAAAACAVGDFLEGFGVGEAPGFEDWLAAERLAIRARAVEALLHRAEALQRAGDLSGSIECARRALGLEPVSAGAARALMTALALRGERAEALTVFDAFARRLQESLGAGPDAPTAMLAEQVRRGRAWRERRDSTPRGAESRRAPLIGRDDALARLIDVWRGARGGRAAVALIEGANGTGRTRLLEEIVERARLDGAAVAEVRGTPADRGVPWTAVFALARGGLLSAPGIAAASGEALAAFAQRLEEWGDRFPAARTSPRALGPGAALAELARAAAAEQALVLAIDDAHWLDADSLGLLQALARDLAGCPVLIVLTAAPHPPRDEIDLLRSRLGREITGSTVTLEPLGSDALRRLAAWAMPSYSDAEADRLARRLAADSAGLPLLAVELLHAVALGLDLHGTPRAWPDPQRTLDQTLPGDLPETVVAAIRIGFRRLGKDTQAAVAAAAVLEGRADIQRLARATGLAESALADALDEAEWERWITADGRGYGFVARVAREVVARDLVTEGQRQRLLARGAMA